MDIMSSIAALSAAGKGAKDLLEIREIALSADAKLKIADIQLALAEARTTLAEVKENILRLEKEMQDLKFSRETIENLKRKGILFYDNETQIYKCPTCIELDQKIISLSPNVNQNPYSYKCNKCQSEFKNPDYVIDNFDYNSSRRQRYLDE